LDWKKIWRGRVTVRKRERRNEREGDLFKKNMKRERNSESEREEMESLRERDGEYENPKQKESGWQRRLEAI
jgi:hypothetical protein